MSKTPEEIAKLYDDMIVSKDSFVAGYNAGYQAAMNSPEKQDSCEHILDMEKMVDADKVMFCVYCNDMHKGNCAVGKGKNHPALTQPQWISVKDRLPEVFKVYNYYRDSNCVLITVAKESDQQTPINPYATVAHLAQFQSEEPMWTACRCSVSGNEVEPNEWKLDQVTHWQPLPKPPEDK